MRVADGGDDLHHANDNFVISQLTGTLCERVDSCVKCSPGSFGEWIDVSLRQFSFQQREIIAPTLSTVGGRGRLRDRSQAREQRNDQGD